MALKSKKKSSKKKTAGKPFKKGHKKLGGRVIGTPNKTTVQRAIRDGLYNLNGRTLAILNSANGIKLWDKSINVLLQNASLGDIRSLQLINEFAENKHLWLERNMVLPEMNADIIEVISIPGLTLETLTIAFARKMQKYCDSASRLTLFTEQAQWVIDNFHIAAKLELEVQKVDLVRSNTVTTQQLHTVFGSLVETVHDILGIEGRAPLLSEILEGFRDRLKPSMPHLTSFLDNPGLLLESENLDDGVGS